MLSRSASRTVRPLRRLLREMLAAGELDAAERRAARQLLVSFALSEQVAEEIVRTAKASGLAGDIQDAGDGDEGATAFEKIVAFLRENWSTIVIQAIFLILPKLLGDEGEGDSEATNEEESES